MLLQITNDSSDFFFPGLERSFVGRQLLSQFPILVTIHKLGLFCRDRAQEALFRHLLYIAKAQLREELAIVLQIRSQSRGRALLVRGIRRSLCRRCGIEDWL